MKKFIAAMVLLLCIPVLCSCSADSRQYGILTGGRNSMQTDFSLFDKVCSADEALALAKENGVVVFDGMKLISGGEVWDDFYAKASGGKRASVLCAHYYTLDKEHVSEELYEEEKDQYPQLYFYLLEYNGKTYTLTTRESGSETPDSAESYKYLAHYTGKPSSPYALFSEYDYYVLVDDPDVTWEDIERGMFSSQYGDWIRHSSVYTNTID